MSMTDWDNVQFSAQGNLVDVTQRVEPGPPPDKTWKRLDWYACTAPKIFECFVAISEHRSVDYQFIDGAWCHRVTGVEYNYVIASEIFTDSEGTWVRLVTHDCFTDWEKIPAADRPPAPAPARAVLVKHVWVMHDKPSNR